MRSLRGTTIREHVTTLSLPDPFIFFERLYFNQSIRHLHVNGGIRHSSIIFFQKYIIF